MRSRPFAQLLSAVLSNAWLPGFVRGAIFTGASKRLCVPTLNCYSCPGALFACPVGAAQVTLAAGGGFDPTAPATILNRMQVILASTPLYVIGFLTLVGALVGRASCGWLCPFGALQDLLARLRAGPKWSPPRWFGWFRYLTLALLVVVLPAMQLEIAWFSSARTTQGWLQPTMSGEGEPSFCKYLCPAGTVTGGLLLPAFRADLREMCGKLYAFKLTILGVLLVTMVWVKRPFCNWLCPLGAFFGPFNRVAVVSIEFDADRCIRCRACQRACPAGIEPTTDTATDDCLRCHDCVNTCPTASFRLTPRPLETWRRPTGADEPKEPVTPVSMAGTGTASGTIVPPVNGGTGTRPETDRGPSEVAHPETERTALPPQDRARRTSQDAPRRGATPDIVPRVAEFAPCNGDDPHDPTRGRLPSGRVQKQECH